MTAASPSDSEAAILEPAGPPARVPRRGEALARFLVRRLAQAVLVVWLAFTVAFLLLNVLPGDAALARLGGGSEGAATQISDEQLRSLRHRLGLDVPVLEQYADQLAGIVTFDLGTSAQTGQAVTQVLGDAMPDTLALAAAAFAVAVVAGGLLGALAAFTRRRALRAALLSVGAVGMAVPTFWVGLALISLLSFTWPVFPAGGSGGVDALVLPALTLAVVPTAMIMQVFSESLIAALGEPYATTAVMKGAGRLRVLVRHGVRNALVPVVTLAGVIAGYLLAGSVVVETVFSRPGIGTVLVGAVEAADLPVISGLVLFVAAVFVAVNLVVDLVCPIIDPRLRSA